MQQYTQEDFELAYKAWTEAKQKEKDAQEERRKIEDWLTKAHSIPEDLDGTEKRESDRYLIKVTGRLNRKVNSQQVEAIAAETGLTAALDVLFRWKAEINLTEWKRAPLEVSQVFAPAIETKPGRPSFEIITKE